MVWGYSLLFFVVLFVYIMVPDPGQVLYRMWDRVVPNLVLGVYRLWDRVVCWWVAGSGVAVVFFRRCFRVG